MVKSRGQWRLPTRATVEKALGDYASEVRLGGDSSRRGTRSCLRRHLGSINEPMRWHKTMFPNDPLSWVALVVAGLIVRAIYFRVALADRRKTNGALDTINRKLDDVLDRLKGR